MTERNRVINHTEGACPACGGGLIFYADDKIIEGHWIGWTWCCVRCKSTGVEWSEATFSYNEITSAYEKEKEANDGKENIQRRCGMSAD